MAQGSYLFPYHTCEPPLHRGSWWAVQPISSAINAATTLMLVGHAAMCARSAAVRVMLATYAAFEGWHVFNHMVHIPSSSIQAAATHLLNYGMSITTLAALVHLSPRQQLHLGRRGVLLVLAALLLDVWACAVLGGVWMIASGLGVFAAVVLSQWSSLPKFLQAQLPTMLAGVAVLLLLFANEALNCQRLLEWRSLPYHAAIEVLGFWLFYRLARAAVQWDAVVANEQWRPTHPLHSGWQVLLWHLLARQEGQERLLGMLKRKDKQEMV